MRRFVIRALTAVALVAAVAPAARGQILNTLRGFEDEAGLQLKAGATFTASGGNTEYLQIAGAVRGQFQTAAERVRLIAGATRRTSDSATIAENSVVHLRHNHRLLPWLHSLAFVQHQWNPFQRLRSRFLLGAGARFDVVRREGGDLSIGTSVMLEVERIEDESGADTDRRWSSFLSARLDLIDRVAAEATAFIQPELGDFGDVRAIADGNLRFHIGERVDLLWGGNYAYDARPPAEVEKTDWATSTGLEVKF